MASGFEPLGWVFAKDLNSSQHNQEEYGCHDKETAIFTVDPVFLVT